MYRNVEISLNTSVRLSNRSNYYPFPFKLEFSFSLQ